MKILIGDDCRYSKLRKDWVNACEGCIKLIAGDLGKRIHKDKEEETAKHMDVIGRLQGAITALCSIDSDDDDDES